MTTGTAKVTYVFEKYSLNMQIVVSLDKQRFEAADNNYYQGYAILSGAGHYVWEGGKHTFQVAPQSINPYNVLWATSGSGSGGSDVGIDTYGISILRDDGNLSWNKDQPSDFAFQEGAISDPSVKLASVHGWPPRG